MHATNDEQLLQLPDSILEPLSLWWSNMEDRAPEFTYLPRGLWVTGPRGVGTSYVAKRAMRRAKMWLENWPFGVVWHDSVSAVQLPAAVRDVWSLEQGVRHNPEDFVLWQEHDRANQQLDWWLDDATVSFIDDLHTGYDASFWAKHIGPRLEGKIKNGKGVIIASDMTPDVVVGDMWPNLYVVCQVDEDSIAGR